MASLVAQMVKNLPAVQKSWVWSLVGRSPREGNGYPLQYSCLKNSMDRGAWWATVWGGGLKRVRHDWTAFTHFQTLDSSSFKHFLKLNSSPLLFIVYKNGNKGPEILRNCSKIPYGHIKKLGILFCIIRGTCPRQILRTDTTNRSLSTSSLTYGRHC